MGSGIAHRRGNIIYVQTRTFAALDVHKIFQGGYLASISSCICFHAKVIRFLNYHELSNLHVRTRALAGRRDSALETPRAFQDPQKDVQLFVEHVVQSSSAYCILNSTRNLDIQIASSNSGSRCTHQIIYDECHNCHCLEEGRHKSSLGQSCCQKQCCEETANTLDSHIFKTLSEAQDTAPCADLPVCYAEKGT